MELSSEDKRRIEEEELKRAAEERYRGEVRAKLQGPPALVQRSPLPWILGIVAVLIVGVIFWSKTSASDVTQKSQAASSPLVVKPSPVPKTRYVPVVQKIVSGQIIVKARGYVQYRLTITSEMVEPTIAGTFNASGGGGNDIAAVIADETNYANWINGHQAQVFWSTQGRETTGKFEVRLPPGMYYLAFSNRFSMFADKQVFLEAGLNYKRAETYYDGPVGQRVACPVPPCTEVNPYRVKMPGDDSSTPAH
jgi:hypothetical protein